MLFGSLPFLMVLVFTPSGNCTFGSRQLSLALLAGQAAEIGLDQ